MKTRFGIITGLSLFALLLSGCGAANEGGSSGGEGTNPPVTDNSYTITWKNYDGSTLEIDANVKKRRHPNL